MLKITLTRSLIGTKPKQRANAEALGLRRIGDTREFAENPALLGKINIISHLVSVETGEAKVASGTAKPEAKAKVPKIKSVAPVKPSEHKAETGDVTAEDKPKRTRKTAAEKTIEE